MKTMQHKFVEFIPEILEDNTLYISIEYRTASHNCVCGCGNRVVTPITPNDWKLIFNGKTVSLSPSIGNWNFDCKSHYWIENNKIKFASKWSDEKIGDGRKADAVKKKKYFKKKKK
jgi:hypothetical protein